LIEQQAEKAPQNFAVQYENQHFLTYQELNSTSNAVARQLGPVSGTIIPVALSRSANLIVALLAVLKAGTLPSSPLLIKEDVLIYP
jgi:non-ribosomal peptide synthetase component F